MLSICLFDAVTVPRPSTISPHPQNAATSALAFYLLYTSRGEQCIVDFKHNGCGRNR